MIVINPSLNDFILIANTDLKEVDHNFEFRLNPFLLTIPTAKDGQMTVRAARAACLVLAYYWTGLDRGGLTPDLLRRDVKEIAEILETWVEGIIKERERLLGELADAKTSD